VNKENISNYVCGSIDIFYLLRIVHTDIPNIFLYMNCTIRYRRIGWAIRGWEEAHLKTIWTFLKILMKTFLVWCNANYVYIHRILLMNINLFKYFWNDIRGLNFYFLSIIYFNIQVYQLLLHIFIIIVISIIYQTAF